MIPKVGSGKSFSDLANYLAASNPGRVAWSDTRRLATHDPIAAAAIMEATAVQNVRTTAPVYHLTLSFHPTDVVDRATMEAASDRVLHDLRLHEHQVLMVAHNDHAHAHVHLMVNRVHPETFRAWDRWKDYHTIESSLRSIERDYGLYQVDGYPRTRDPQTQAPERATPAREPDTHVDHDRMNGAGRDVGAEAVAGAREYVDAKYRADLADRATSEAEMARAHVDQWERAKARAESAMLRFEETLGKIYTDPAQAAKRFFAHTDRPGVSSAHEELVHRPGTFGTLHPDSPIAKDVAGKARFEGAARDLTTQASTCGLEAYDAARTVHGIAKAHGVDHLSLYEVSAMLQARAHGAAERSVAARAARDAAPSVADARHKLARTLRGISSEGLAVLDRALSAAELAIVKPVVARVTNALLGREEQGR